ncbi:MAG TPA: hypothetical protein VI874_04045, partial [Candidatus Norongarragalinales archaeon]|nr:hypothetical protein [Candidatus Norongarragalinales archaeon]
MRALVFALFLIVPMIAASIQVSVEDQTTCRCDLATFSVVAKNTGDTQAFDVLYAQTPRNIQPQSVDVTLSAGEKKSFLFYAQSPCGNVASIPVSFRTSTLQTEATLYGKSCDGFTLSVTPEQTACANQFAQFSVTLANTGRSAQDILLSTDLNQESASLIGRVLVPAHETKNVLLTVNAPAVPQRLPFKVFAENLGVKMEQPAILTVRSCQGISFSGPERIVLTQGGSANATLLIRNIGGSRTIRVEAFCPAFVTAKNVTLTLNASQTAPYSFMVNATVPGTFLCSVFATPADEGRNYLKTVLLEIRPKAAAENGAINVTPRAFSVEKGLESKLVFSLKTDQNRTVNARLRLENVDVL